MQRPATSTFAAVFAPAPAAAPSAASPSVLPTTPCDPSLTTDVLATERAATLLSRSAAPVRRTLAALAQRLVSTEGWSRLGFARLQDYAVERLGLSARSVYDLAALDRSLSELPHIAEAFARGELGWTKLRLLARVASHDDQHAWLTVASSMTTSALAREVRAVDTGAVHDTLDRADLEPSDAVTRELGENFRIPCHTGLLGQWHRARHFAARVAGHTVRPWECMEMITAETLSAVPLDAEPTSPTPATDDTAATEALARGGLAPHLPRPRHGVAQSGGDPPPAPHEAPVFPTDTTFVFRRLQQLVADLDEVDAFELDARLRHVIRLEQQLDAELGTRLATLAAGRPHHLWGFQSFEAYARARFGISPRKARALMRLERVGARVSAFRGAYREGALSWVQAQALIPIVLIDRGAHAPAWIDRAMQVTVRRLRDDVAHALLLHETEPDAFSVSAGLPSDTGDAARISPTDTIAERQLGANPTPGQEASQLVVHGPCNVVRLARAALCTVRRTIEHRTGRLPTKGEAFALMLEHALATWGASAAVKPAHRIFARDGWRCTAPGCSSQQNLHDHHIVFRSAGGSNDLTNRTTLCAWHHLRGVHGGTIRCTGKAPDALHFDLGLRRDRPPLLRFAPGERRFDL